MNLLCNSSSWGRCTNMPQGLAGSRPSMPASGTWDAQVDLSSLQLSSIVLFYLAVSTLHGVVVCLIM